MSEHVDRHLDDDQSLEPTSSEMANDSHPDQQLLVAYLDGELEDSQVKQVENRLAQENGLRSQLKSLQQTWDWLDQLPSHVVDESFTRSTIEMVVKDVEKKRFQRWQSWIWPARLIAGLLFVIVPALTTFSFIRYYQLAPLRELVSNLDFWESMDLYDAPPNIGFLEKLDESGILPEETLGETAEILPADDPIVSEQMSLAPQKRFQQLSESDRLEIRLNQERFESLSDSEKQRYRELHSALMSHESRKRMLKVANDYKNWLATIDLEQRRELRNMENEEELLEKIAELRAKQEEELLGTIGDTAVPQDERAQLTAWVEGFVQEKYEQLRKQAGQRTDRWLRNFSKPLQPYILMHQYLRREQDPKKLIDQAAIESLHDQMSDAVDAIIENQGDHDAQAKLVAAWITNACRAKTRPPVSDQELYEFLMTLPPETISRYNFDDMSPIQWQSELKRLYYRYHQMN